MPQELEPLMTADPVQGPDPAGAAETAATETAATRRRTRSKMQHKAFGEPQELDAEMERGEEAAAGAAARRGSPRRTKAAAAGGKSGGKKTQKREKRMKKVSSSVVDCEDEFIPGDAPARRSDAKQSTARSGIEACPQEEDEECRVVDEEDSPGLRSLNNCSYDDSDDETLINDEATDDGEIEIDDSNDDAERNDDSIQAIETSSMPDLGYLDIEVSRSTRKRARGSKKSKWTSSKSDNDPHEVHESEPTSMHSTDVPDIHVASEEEDRDDAELVHDISISNLGCPSCWTGIWQSLRRYRRRRVKYSRSRCRASRKSQTMAESHSSALLSESEDPERSPAVAVQEETDQAGERAQALRALLSPTWGEFMETLEARDLDGVRRIVGQPQVQRALPVWKNSRGESILHVLCRTHGAAVLDLILLGIDAPTRCSLVSGVTERGRGMLPLHVASAEGDVDSVRVLLRHGAAARCPRDNYGLTALHRAAGNGHGEICRVLLEAGADSLVRDHGGFTAWHRACFHGHVDVLKALMFNEEDEHHSYARFIEEDTKLTSRGRSALHHVVSNASSGPNCEEMVRLLVHGVGVNPNLRCSEGRTPLHDAALSGNVYAVDALLRFGANINMQVTGSGSTPLHLAVENFQIGVCATLLQHPDINLCVRDASGLTPELLAVDESRYEILDVFGSPEIGRARAKNKALKRAQGQSSPRAHSAYVSPGAGATAANSTGAKRATKSSSRSVAIW